MTTLGLLEAEVRMLTLRVKELEGLTQHLRVARQLSDDLPQPSNDDAMVAELCTYVGGTAKEMMGPNRERRVVALRRLLVRHLRTHGWSWQRIAAAFRFSEKAARKLGI